MSEYLVKDQNFPRACQMQKTFKEEVIIICMSISSHFAGRASDSDCSGAEDEVNNFKDDY